MIQQKTLPESFQQLADALKALKEALDTPMQQNRLNIDGTIQRFEFTIELYWKVLGKILRSEGLEIVYPKDILRAAYKGELIDNEQLWLQMLKDRNLSSHSYNKELADTIYKNLYDYYPVLEKTYQNLKTNYATS